MLCRLQSAWAQRLQRAACGILVPRPGIELEFLHWEVTTREVLMNMGCVCLVFFNCLHHCFVVLRVYKSFTSLVTFIPKYFILFGAVVNGLKKISFLSCSF